MKKQTGLFGLVFLLLFAGTLCAQVTVSNTTLATGMEMVPYSDQLQATGGTAPYTWSIPVDCAEQPQFNSFDDAVADPSCRGCL